MSSELDFKRPRGRLNSTLREDSEVGRPEGVVENLNSSEVVTYSVKEFY